MFMKNERNFKEKLVWLNWGCTFKLLFYLFCCFFTLPYSSTSRIYLFTLFSNWLVSFKNEPEMKYVNRKLFNHTSQKMYLYRICSRNTLTCFCLLIKCSFSFKFIVTIKTVQLSLLLEYYNKKNKRNLDRLYYFKPRQRKSK